MRRQRAAKTFVSAFLLAAIAGAPALAEQVGTMPINANTLSTEGTFFNDSDSGDFVMRDASSGQVWQFRSGDPEFYQLLKTLDGVAGGNVSQLAYVGNPPGSALAAPHGAWVAPLGADNQASIYPNAKAPKGATVFDPQALSVQQTSEGYVLTDGVSNVASTGRYSDTSSLELLKTMIQTYALNAVSQQSGVAVTPVSNAGPVSVFLKVDGRTATAMNTSGENSCKWWSPKCWSKDRKEKPAS